MLCLLQCYVQLQLFCCCLFCYSHVAKRNASVDLGISSALVSFDSVVVLHALQFSACESCNNDATTKYFIIYKL